METNQRMSEAWNGPESVHYVDHADRYDRQLAPITDEVLARAAIERGDTVLDVGCGSGAMAIVAARRAGRVVGLDISDPLLAVARERATAAGADHLEFVLGDAQVHPFDAGGFDAIISQFGLMFFDDPSAAFSNLHRALRPGGRLAFACWQGLEHNEWLAPVVRVVEPHAEVPDLGGLANGGGMFAFKHRDEVAGLLGDTGFHDVDVVSFGPELSIAGGGTADECADFLLGLGIVRGLLGRLDEVIRAEAEEAVRTEMRRRHAHGAVTLACGVWIATATA